MLGVGCWILVSGVYKFRETPIFVGTEIPINSTGVYIVKTGGTVKRVVVN